MTTYEEKLALAAEMRKGTLLDGEMSFWRDCERLAKEREVLPDYVPGGPHNTPTRWERPDPGQTKLEDLSNLPGARRQDKHKGGRGKKKL